MNQNTEFTPVEILRKSEVSAALIDAATDFYRRGWLLGTSGNLSAVLRQDPFRIAITGSGVDKGHLREDQIIEVDETVLKTLCDVLHRSVRIVCHLGPSCF